MAVTRPLRHNAPSQRVLARNGFRPFAVCASYLNIAGKWQDHILLQRLNRPDPPPGAAPAVRHGPRPRIMLARLGSAG